MGILNKNEQARLDAELRIIQPQLLKSGWEARQVLHRRRFAPARPAPSFTLEFRPHFPLAIIQFVGDDESLITALDHAIPSADTEDGGLDVPFVYSTNGCNFQEYNTITHQKRFLGLPDFPSPISLWNQLTFCKGIRPALAVKLHTSWEGFDRQGAPRHFEAAALRRIVEAILTGRRRMSLTIGAPGSSHYLAARLFAHLWKERLAKRFLYLPDWGEPLLLNAIRPQFQSFDQLMIDDLTACPVESDFKGQVFIPAGYELEALLLDFPPHYFDLVMVDEFQRRTEEEDGNWQALLSHFQPATHIGLSAFSSHTSEFWFGRTIYRYTMHHLERDGFRPGDKENWSPPKNTPYFYSELARKQRGEPSSKIIHEIALPTLQCPVGLGVTST